jgi:hypothetical protein
MGQAKNRGTREERVVAAIELLKTQPRAQKKLNKTQLRMVAVQTAMNMMHELLGPQDPVADIIQVVSKSRY